jgi:cytochrome c556
MPWHSATITAVLASLLVAGGAALAQDALTARKEEMKEFGRRTEAIKIIVVDGQGALGDVPAHAEHIVAKASQIPSWFPPGSDAGETRALPAVWERPGDFEAKAANLEQLARALAAAAASGNEAATTAAFAELGQNGCGGCHRDFRRPQS